VYGVCYRLRGGVGGSYTYHYVTLVSQRGVPAGNTEELYIYHYNLQTGVNTTYSPSQLGKFVLSSVMNNLFS